MNRTKFKYIIKIFLFMLLINIQVFSQNYLLQTLSDNKTQIGLKYQRPDFKSDANLSTFAGVYDISTNFPITKNLNIVVNLPIVGYSNRDGGSEEGIGNILLALQYHNILSGQYKAVLTIGACLPTIASKNSIMQPFGMSTNFYEFSKYSGDTFTIYANYAYFNHIIRDISFCVEVGPDIQFLKQSIDGSKTKFYAHYGARVALKINSVTLSTEYQGIIKISGNANNFSDRMLQGLLVGVQWNKGWFRPKGYYNFYLKEDMTNIVNGVVGVGIDFWF